MTDQLIEPEVIPAIPVTELEKINATDAGFARIAAEIDTYIETGIIDEKANDIVQVCVKIRTSSLKLAKELAAPYGQKYDEIMAYGKALGDRAKAQEDRIRPLKDAYEAEKERVKREKAEAEAARIASRIDALYKLGATFDNITYNVHGVLIDAVEVKALPDAEYADLYSSAEAAYQTEQARLAQIEAQRIADAQALEAQRQAQEAERLRLQAIADEQAKQQREFERQRAEFEKQQREAENARLQAIADEEARNRKIENDRIRAEQAQKAEAEQAKYAAEQHRIAKKEAADKQKADKERTRRLAPDKKNFAMWLNTHRYNEILIGLNEPEVIELNKQFNERMQAIVSEFKLAVSTL